MKYALIAIIVIVAGLLAFHFMKTPGTQTPQTAALPAGVVLANWHQPQACPQYGGAKQCYVAEGAFGGYLNWASTRATFLWRVNPCPTGKKVIKISSSSCVYETNGVSHTASTSVDQNGYATVDCRPFASSYKDDECNCNNGITLNAQVECR
ncbi:hypothetical protein HY090_02980 [Candidatus Kaiserbacteria bacterium]|nr:hypothetical protein [Candidatus Kaiserbacteria bacterium]